MSVEPERPLMTSAEVATLFRVDPKTVTGWVRDGLLTSIRTPGGSLRFREADVQRLLDQNPETSGPGTGTPPSSGPGPATTTPPGR